VLPFELSNQAEEGENERPVTIDGFVSDRASNLIDTNKNRNTTVQAVAEFSGDSANDLILDLGKWQGNWIIDGRVTVEFVCRFVMQYVLADNLRCFQLQSFPLCLPITASISLNLFFPKSVLACIQIGKSVIVKKSAVKMIEQN
jgi:hypothetical protein